MFYSKINSNFATLLVTFFAALLFMTTGCSESSSTPVETFTYYRDADGDGYGNPNDSKEETNQPDGYVENDDDCDDTDASISPGTVEICDSVDNNCDSQTDEGCSTYYHDADGDGYGDINDSLEDTSQPAGYVTDSTDCDDNDTAIHPGAAEVCGDTIDQDCDGADEICPDTYYRDADGDGYGDINDSIEDTSEPLGYVTDDNDCDDTDAAIHPGATEICGDTIDQDCDGSDTACPPSGTYYKDADGDGFGDPNDSVTDSSQPAGYVVDNTDCDDTNAAINPGAAEICDSVDNDCDGQTDEGCTTYFEDSDGDGYGNAAVSVINTSPPTGYVADDTDCDDTNALISPGTTEVCDGVDNNCDTQIDEGCPITFEITLGGISDDNGKSVQQTSDGGYILSGKTGSFGADLTDMYLVKTDATGNESWFNTFGGISYEDSYSTQQTSDGGYILLGYTRSFGAGYMDLYLVKTDPAGNESWFNTFGGTSPDEEIGRSVQQTLDGGYILLGEVTSFGAGFTDMYLVKTDATGTESWFNTFGGTDWEYSFSVQQTSDGGYILSGLTGSFGAGVVDIYLVKTDAAGNESWFNTFGGIDAEAGFSVQQTSDGGYIILGYTNSFGAGGFDMYLVKTDAAGTEGWFKTFGGTGPEMGFSVQQTSDGGYILLGKTDSFGAGFTDMYLVKTDAAGNESWFKTFGGTGSDMGLSVKQASDGGYILLGETSSFGAGGYDMYLVKTDADGNVY